MMAGSRPSVPRWLPPLAAALLVLLQAYAFFRVVPLSLGPRVILQPWLLAQHGFVMYDQIADQHTPLMPLVLSWIAPWFSEGWRAARAALVILLSLTTALTYLAARRDGGRWAGLIATACVVCWSASFGFGKLWHESFLSPLYVLIFLLEAPARQPMSRRRTAAVGLCGGLAFLVKQTAVAAVGVVVAWHLVQAWKRGAARRILFVDAAILAVATLAPPVTYVAIHLAHGGSVSAFWYWTAAFTRESGFMTLAALRPTLPELLAIAPAYALVPAAAWLGLVRSPAASTAWERSGLAVLLLVVTSLGAYPRYGAFHLAPSLPFVAWLSAMAFAGAVGEWLEEERRGALALPLAAGVVMMWAVSGAATYERVVGPPQFRPIAEYTDVQPLADAVKPHIAPGDSIYVFPDDEAIANVYYLLQAPPPRFWIFHYPWYVTPAVSERVLTTVTNAAPMWIIHQGDPWGIGNRAPGMFAYLQAHYQTVATVRWNTHDVQVLRRVK